MSQSAVLEDAGRASGGAASGAVVGSGRDVWAGRDVRAGRDSAVDVARAACLVMVVLLHSLMVGVSVTAGAPVLENALDGWSGLPALTWLAQVMPLFFVLGGFSSSLHWFGMRARGTTPAAYVAARMRRLLLPAAAAIGASAVVLSVLTLVGVPAAVVATAGFRLSQPLWFLGVYVLCTAAVPLTVAAHRRHPVGSLVVLAALAVSVDVVRLSTGVTAVGFANLLFVWLLVQQLGYALADGTVAALPRRARGAIAVGSLAALFVLAATGVYSFDLLADLNPPTFALVLLGVAQLCLFDLARPVVSRLARHRMLGAAVRAINARAMTIYSWHMLAIIGLTGLLLLSGMPLPAPRSPEWWGTRGLWLAAVVVVVAAVVAVAGRAEAGRGRAVRAVRAVRAEVRRDAAPLGGVSGLGWLSAASGAGGVLVILLAGSSVAGWVTGCALVAGALAAARRCEARSDEAPILP